MLHRFRSVCMPMDNRSFGSGLILYIIDRYSRFLSDNTFKENVNPHSVNLHVA